MKYDTLKALVNAKVYENTEQEITGEGLNEVLQSAIASLGAHYQMGGLVSPTDHITVGDEPVVFIATTPGTYTYFGSQVVADGEVALLVWSGTAWSKQIPDISTRTELSQLGQEIYGKIEGEYTITGYNNKCLTLNLKKGFTYTFKVDSSSNGTLYRQVFDSEGNSIYNPGGTSEIPNSFSFTPSQDYSGAYLELGMSGTNTFSITVTTIGLIESAIKGWILSEAFNIQNGTYTDGIINSPVSIIWPDGVMGTLIITRGDNALVNTISATHGSDSYLLSITRDNNGFVTGTNIIKQ